MEQETADVLKHIADKLDVPVQQLWAGLIAYAPFTFYQWAIGVGMGIFAFVALGWISYKTAGTELSKKTDGFVPGMCGFLAVVAFALVAMFGLGETADALSAKYAPEAWASKYILKRLDR